MYTFVEEKMEGKFLPGDFDTRKDGTVVWKNNVAWQRMAMVQAGEMKRKSPRGIWELSNSGA